MRYQWIDEYLLNKRLPNDAGLLFKVLGMEPGTGFATRSAARCLPLSAWIRTTNHTISP